MPTRISDCGLKLLTDLVIWDTCTLCLVIERQIAKMAQQSQHIILAIYLMHVVTEP